MSHARNACWAKLSGARRLTPSHRAGAGAGAVGGAGSSGGLGRTVSPCSHRNTRAGAGCHGGSGGDADASVGTPMHPARAERMKKAVKFRSLGACCAAASAAPSPTERHPAGPPLRVPAAAGAALAVAAADAGAAGVDAAEAPRQNRVPLISAG